MLCGKIAAGKSTLATKLATQPSTIVLSEDFWLKGLFPVEMTSVADFARYSSRLREIIGPHVEDLLRIGISVVLDFHANTVAARAWMRTLCDGAGAHHTLYFLDVPDAVCRERLHRRNASRLHEFAPIDEEFDLITSYFVAPSEAEGLNLVHCKVRSGLRAETEISESHE